MSKPGEAYPPRSGNVPGRFLALDLGERRIGLAVSEPAGGLVFPAGYLERSKLLPDLDRVLQLAAERKVGGIVVGMPYTLAGGLGRQGKLAQGFVRALRRQTELPVHTVDERFTSYEAEALLRESGQEPSRDKGAVDAAAAVLILQRFLSSVSR